MRFADIGRDHNLGVLLENALTICPVSGKMIVDDELFWRMLQANEDSHQFFAQNHIHSLDQLMDDYNEWYEENAFTDHYRYGDDRLLYPYE